MKLVKRKKKSIILTVFLGIKLLSQLGLQKVLPKNNVGFFKN